MFTKVRKDGCARYSAKKRSLFWGMSVGLVGLWGMSVGLVSLRGMSVGLVGLWILRRERGKQGGTVGDLSHP
ncbi:MAG: hypothetical protein IKM59_08225 [Oscillospiraceae bacterium]|nr:hypothetical protein [Oscillospiraceae bacterium]